MIRVVLDTHTIISALFWPGPPAQIYSAANGRTFTVVATMELVNELNEVLSRPKFAAALSARLKTANIMVAEYRELAEVVEPADIPANVIRDPKDRHILACAVGGNVDFVVSGDKDLLVLGSYENIPILTATQFLQNLSVE